MKILALLVCSVGLLLGGCATPTYNYQPESISISEPPINSTNTSQVGDEMLNQGKYQQAEALYLSQPNSVRWAYTLHPGFYRKTGDDATGEFFLPSSGPQAGHIERAGLADPWKAVMLKKEQPNLCVVTVLNVAACVNGEGVERRKQRIVSQDSFQQTLIYSGKVGNKINIGYREFSNNNARPAFNNNVEYDLSESKTIGYKGAQLEIIEATNQTITYRVLKNFNAAVR